MTTPHQPEMLLATTWLTKQEYERRLSGSDDEQASMANRTYDHSEPFDEHDLPDIMASALARTGAQPSPTKATPDLPTQVKWTLLDLAARNWRPRCRCHPGEWTGSPGDAAEFVRLYTAQQDRESQGATAP